VTDNRALAAAIAEQRRRRQASNSGSLNLPSSEEVPGAAAAPAGAAAALSNGIKRAVALAWRLKIGLGAMSCVLNAYASLICLRSDRSGMNVFRVVVMTLAYASIPVWVLMKGKLTTIVALSFPRRRRLAAILSAAVMVGFLALSFTHVASALADLTPRGAETIGLTHEQHSYCFAAVIDAGLLVCDLIEMLGGGEEQA
jgi:hypothetical protein